MLVTDVSDPPGLTVVRSLGRAGWDVIATESIGSRPSGTPSRFRSRWASHTVAVPDPELDGRATGRVLGQLAAEHDVDLIFPVTDKSILAVLDHGTVGDRPVAVPRREALEAAWDKTATVALATSLGVPVPRSISFETSGEAQAAAADMGCRAVLKPRRSHEWQGDGSIVTRSVHMLHCAGDWTEAHEADSATGGMVQEYLPGFGVGVEILARRGQVEVAFQHRRIHEVPLDGGMSARRVAEQPDPELLEHARRLVEALGWDGLIMVEFRMTPDGPRLMELNGRVWGSMALPVRAGVDFPRMAADLHLGREPNGDASALIEGLECVNFGLELRWLIEALRRRRRGDDRIDDAELWRTAVGLVDPRTEFDVQRLDDPVPSVLDAFGAFADVFRGLRTALGEQIATRRAV